MHYLTKIEDSGDDEYQDICNKFQNKLCQKEVDNWNIGNSSDWYIFTFRFDSCLRKL